MWKVKLGSDEPELEPLSAMFFFTILMKDETGTAFR
jgi:hypothetical protein